MADDLAASHPEPPLPDEPPETARFTTLDLMYGAVAAEQEGNLEVALRIAETAARRGNVSGMTTAGRLAKDLGNLDAARHWSTAAADAGEVAAMYNLGLLHLEAGELARSRYWFERVVEEGEVSGYPALVELFERAGDDSGARHWAAEGARHDEPRCLEVRAIQLMSDSIDNVDTALPMLERAAELGNVNAMCIAGMTHFRVRDDRAKAREWLLRAEAAGDPDGRRKLIEYGLA